MKHTKHLKLVFILVLISLMACDKWEDKTCRLTVDVDRYLFFNRLERIQVTLFKSEADAKNHKNSIEYHDSDSSGRVIFYKVLQPDSVYWVTAAKGLISYKLEKTPPLKPKTNYLTIWMP